MIVVISAGTDLIERLGADYLDSVPLFPESRLAEFVGSKDSYPVRIATVLALHRVHKRRGHQDYLDGGGKKVTLFS